MPLYLMFSILCNKTIQQNDESCLWVADGIQWILALPLAEILL